MNTIVELERARRYAWYNLIVGFVAYFYILGFPNILMPVLYPDIILDTGWSRAEVISFATYKFITMTIFVFLLAFWIDVVGARLLLIAGALIIGLSMSAFMYIDSLWMYYMLAVMFGIGSICANLSVKVILSRWFYARQGRVIGFVLVGSGVVGVIAPVITEMMSQAFGWRATVVLLSIGIYLLILPLILFFTRDDPKDYGYDSREIDPGAKETNEQPISDSDQPDFSTIKNSMNFWLVGLAIFLIALVEGGMMQHTKTFLQLDIGFSGTEAAWFFTLTMLISLAGRFLFGWSYDLWSVKGVALCYMFIGLGALLGFFVTGMVTAFVFCIIRGLAHGGVLVDVPVLAKHVFGMRSLSKIMAVYTGAYSLGMATGAWSFGYSHDLLGSYMEIFLLSILLSILAAWLVYRVQPRYWHR